MSGPIRNRWRARFDRTRGRLPRELADLLSPPRRSEPTTVGLLGSFSAGKSTLVSALLGEHVAATFALPTSRCVTSFSFGPCPRFLVLAEGRLVSETTLGSSEAWAQRWYEAKPLVDSLPPAHTTVGQEVRVELPNPLLRPGVEMLDTPGHDSGDAHDSAMAETAVERADAALYLCPRDHILSAADLPFIERLVANEVPWALVITYVGRVGRSPRRRKQWIDRANAVCARWDHRPLIFLAPEPGISGDREWTARVQAIRSTIIGWAVQPCPTTVRAGKRSA